MTKLRELKGFEEAVPKNYENIQLAKNEFADGYCSGMGSAIDQISDVNLVVDDGKVRKLFSSIQIELKYSNTIMPELTGIIFKNKKEIEDEIINNIGSFIRLEKSDDKQD